jgi:uroporphyrinogen-III synthase
MTPNELPQPQPASDTVAVLITRPQPGASETAARIAAMGLNPIVAPFLHIRPSPVRLPETQWIAAILLASGRAVDPLPEYCRTLPVLTVGDATARRAKQAGFTNVISADGDASDLAAHIKARIDPREGTLLLAAGKGQSVALANELRSAGYRVARRVVYAARPVTRLPAAARDALLNDEARIVLFFSTETARCFMRLVEAAGLLGTLRNREAITIGAQVGMALKREYWARVSVAGKPTQDEMLALLQ